MGNHSVRVVAVTSFEKIITQRRRQAEQLRQERLDKWLLTNAQHADSATHQAAFLAGYDSAAGPLPPTWKEVSAQLTQRILEEDSQKHMRLEALPPDACPQCEGTGEFAGATHTTKCPDCKGTGQLR